MLASTHLFKEETKVHIDCPECGRVLVSDLYVKGDCGLWVFSDCCNALGQVGVYERPW